MRGVILFVAVLITIGIWAPLRNRPERLAGGAIVTETYFGVFRYLTLHTEFQEPRYEMKWIPDYKKVALTAGVTAALWGGVVVLARRRNEDQRRNPPA